MKTVKLGVIVALALVFAAGLFAPVQAGVLDATWFKGRIQGETRLFVVNAVSGEVSKVRLNGDFYFKLCSFDPILASTCLGEVYLTLVAVADFDEDGVFELEEVFFLDIDTCGATEQGFNGTITIDDADPGEIGLQQVLGTTNGRVKERNDEYRLRANSGNGGTAATWDNLDTALTPDGVFRKWSWRANPIAVEDLPENLITDLIAAGWFLDADAVLCPSELVVVLD
jgi:hypothetical protein